MKLGIVKISLCFALILDGCLLGCSTGHRESRVLANASQRQEPDILELATKDPVNLTTNAPGTPGYGDPFLAEAVAQLSDIPRPWTVPKMIEIFQREGRIWIRESKANTQESPAQRQARLWGPYLARVLAASRDSRAIVALAESTRNLGLPYAADIYSSLFDYYVRDSNYGLPPEQRIDVFAGNFLDISIPAVDRWWAMNKTVLKAQAEKDENEIRNRVSDKM